MQALQRSADAEQAKLSFERAVACSEMRVHADHVRDGTGGINTESGEMTKFAARAVLIVQVREQVGERSSIAV